VSDKGLLTTPGLWRALTRRGRLFLIAIDGVPNGAIVHNDVVVTATDRRAWHYRVVLTDDAPRAIRCRLRAIETTEAEDDE
jgi:hypothetical protein